MTPLDRKELAARLAAADLANPKFDNELEDPAWTKEWVDGIVRAADALMARLEPDAAPPRPKWVRITGPDDAVRVTVGKVYRVVDWHEELGGGPIVALEIGKWYCYQAHHGDQYRPTWEPAVGPEWVRITGPDGAEDVTVGKAYRVFEWIDVRGGRPMITNDAGREWVCAGPEEEGHETLPTWKPCAAPEPAKEAEWVPKVGDRVRVKRDNANYANVKAGDEFVVTRILPDEGSDAVPSRQLVYGLPSSEFVRVENLEPCAAPSAAKGSDTGTAAAMPGVSPAATPAAWVPSVGDVVKQMTETDAVATTGTIRVVVSTAPLRWVYVESGAKVGGECEPGGWEGEVRFVRRATSSERAAAGLDAEAPAFDEDREREAFCVWLNGWGEASKWGVAGFDNVMDRFMWRAWLARARVAAKGGVA